MQTRRDFLKRSIFVAAAAGAVGSRGLVSRAARAAEANAAQAGPNVLFIMTDQQFADAMSCRMGAKYIRTPAMDSLAEGGALFSRAYSPNPLCMPARGSIFTGRYPHETGVTHNAGAKVDTNDFVCMGTYFKRAGYETAYFGKWHLFMAAKDVAAHGFERFGDSKVGAGPDEHVANGFVKFLSDRSGKPFLAVLSFLNPHNICEFSRDQKLNCGPVGETPPPEKCPPAPANLAPPTNETDTMATMRKGYHASGTFPVGNFSPDKWRQLRWGYYRLIEKVDALIGQVLGAVRKAGIEENTVVIFTADHGECAGAHGWNQKTVFYDESSRVPMIVYQKGRTVKSVCEKLVNTGVDILPTMMDFAGIAKPAKLTGLSLRPLATGEQPGQWRDHVVVEDDLAQAGAIDGFRPAAQGRMVRTDRYKYCIYDKGTRREALFDMQADPLETANLAGDPARRQTLLDHRKILADFAARHNDALAAAMLADDVPPRPFTTGGPGAANETATGKVRKKARK